MEKTLYLESIIDDPATADAVANIMSEKLRKLRQEEQCAEGEELACIRQDIMVIEDAIVLLGRPR